MRDTSLAGATVMYVVNTDWFFLSHRLPLALGASAAGAKVVVVATDTGRADDIRARGLHFEDLGMSRIGTNPLRELRCLGRLTRIVRRHRPDVLHLVATKALIYGGIAARLVGVRGVISAVTGAGYALSQERRGWLQYLVRSLLRQVLRWSAVIVFQHASDRDLYVRLALVDRARCRIISGVGVDPSEWPPLPEPRERLVMLAARMIEDKGVLTFVDAARELRLRLPDVRFVLVGPLEPELPSAVEAADLSRWSTEGLVEWWGARTDMPRVLAQCQVLVLPTYHNEGVPKVLLEAGATGRAVVASDIPGCRVVVEDGRDGILVPPKDAPKLAAAIELLLEDHTARRSMAVSLHRGVIERFRESDLTSATLAIYRDSLSNRVGR